MRRIHFFALKEDFLPVLQLVEAKGELKYTRTGNFTKRNLESYSRGSEIPNLGKATSDASIGCETFLVCKRETAIQAEPFRTNDGVERFCLSQILNPDTVTFTSGGLWNGDILLNGRVATVSDSKPAQDLMKQFHAAIRKHFTRIKAFYVGPRALTLLKAGKRLAGAVQSPREFDLTTEP